MQIWWKRMYYLLLFHAITTTFVLKLDMQKYRLYLFRNSHGIGNDADATVSGIYVRHCLCFKGWSEQVFKSVANSCSTHSAWTLLVQSCSSIGCYCWDSTLKHIFTCFIPLAYAQPKVGPRVGPEEEVVTRRPPDPRRAAAPSVVAWSAAKIFIALSRTAPGFAQNILNKNTFRANGNGLQLFDPPGLVTSTLQFHILKLFF